MKNGLATVQSLIIFNNIRRKCILPSFIDAHNHPEIYGSSLSQISCGFSFFRSIHDLKEKIGMEAKNLYPGEPIIGFGYNEQNFEKKDIQIAGIFTKFVIKTRFILGGLVSTRVS